MKPRKTVLLQPQPYYFSNRKPFSAIVETVLKQTRPTLLRDQRGNSVMWDIINNLYRNYCLARLHEMRKLSIAG